MNREEAEEYTQSVGQVCAGGYRQVVLGKKMGVPQALGLTTAEWVEKRLGGYVRMSIPQRREAVEELLAEGHSQHGVAEYLGIDQATVSRDHDATASPVEPEPPSSEPESDATASPEPEPLPAPAPELTAEQLAEQHEWEEEAKRMAEKQRLAEEHRKVIAELYGKIAQALSTLGGYGRHADIPKLMGDFDPAQLDPPMLDRYFNVENIQDAQRFCAEITKWRKNSAG